jgi:hypothetical protein
MRGILSYQTLSVSKKTFANIGGARLAKEKHQILAILALRPPECLT